MSDKKEVDKIADLIVTRALLNAFETTLNKSIEENKTRNLETPKESRLDFVLLLLKFILAFLVFILFYLLSRINFT